MLIQVDLDPALRKQLPGYFILHAVDPAFVDQVVRAQTDLEPGPLMVGRQALDPGLLKKGF